MSTFCSAKAIHIFSAKNIGILYSESAKTVNEMTLNKLVKLQRFEQLGPENLNTCTRPNKNIRPPPRGRFGRRSRRKSYNFALLVRKGEDDFVLFFDDFRNVLSVLLALVSRFFACLQRTLTNTVALMITNGDTPTTTSCLQKHDIITLIGNYP